MTNVLIIGERDCGGSGMEPGGCFVVMLSRPIFECGHLEQVLRLLAFEAVKDFFMALFAVRSH